MCIILDVSLIRERGSILGKDLSIQILAYLSSNPYSIASEVADRFDIHIATAAKYLSGMEKAKIVASRIRQTGRKPAREYYLLSDKIKLEIDFSKVLENQVSSRLAKQRVRESRNENVAYEWDSDKPIIKEIVLVTEQGGRRKAKKVSLSELEGRFLWYLSFPGTRYKTAAELASLAGISDPRDLEKLEQLLDQLVELGIVERKVTG